MLKSIRLINFQAHIDSFIELNKGITALTGESHEGKTAVQRGLNWAVNNEPVGTGFISYWAKHKTKKGMIVLDIPCKVECVREDGSVLVRERSADFNGYKIDGKDLARAGVGVPSEVAKWFNMGEVNIQGQHDSLFLLHSAGKGGQEVARFLNSVVKLDEIPRALSSVESKKRTVKKLREAETEKITSYEKTLKSLDWVSIAKLVLVRLEKVEKDIIDLTTKELKIIGQIEQYDNLQGILEIHAWSKEVSPLMERWSSIWSKEAPLISLYTHALISIDHLKIAEQIAEDLKWLPEASKTSLEIKEIENEIGFSTLHIQNIEQTIGKHDTAALFLENNQPWLEDTTDKIMQFEMLNHTIEELEIKEESIEDNILKISGLKDLLQIGKTSLQKLKVQLPKICVWCGAPTKDGKYESSR